MRTLEAAEVDPASLTPTLRRDAEELEGFLEFLVDELTHPGLAATVRAVLADRDLAAFPATPDGHHSYAGGLLEHTVGVATLCRETAQLHPRLRSELAARGRAPARRRPDARARARARVRADRGGPPARPRPPRPAADRGARRGPRPAQLAELLHCVAVHHDARAARTAEAAVLYHANQLDAVAATRPVG